ncbi:MAG: hypothetical protein Q7V31_11970 [Parvibaculum sp.]|uniref:hypothetical protein n=1 Tax=Parvibaculum sp. TaxID=2024848 RepID=UPI00271B3C7B|nr:hypothetical protein [Parvibaculum sp.]MDO8839635.1 hypothetical protein [Parvibaculum sp.]
METDKVLVCLPFPGFYESAYSEALDAEEEQHIENAVETDAWELPDELRLDADVFITAICNARHAISSGYEIIAEDYVAAFTHFADDHCGVALPLAFESMTSPRFYNFETDRLFAHASRWSVSEMFARSAWNGHALLAELIADTFTSYDGFISGYPNALATWLEKPLDDWDHNEVAVLIVAALAATAGDKLPAFQRTLRDGLYDYVTDGNTISTAFEATIDWPHYDAAIEAARAARVAALSVDDPDYVAPAPRCPDTGDLFAS